jgi:hypothetical protein
MSDNIQRAIEIDGSFFSYQFEKSRNNKDILLINGKYIHSKFAPEKEGENFIFQGKNLIAIFGIGFGYHVENILKNNKDSIFIIYEPIEEMLELFKKSRFFDNKILFLNKNSIESVFDFLEKTNFFSEGKIKTYSNLGYKNIFQKQEFDFFSSIQKAYEVIVQNTLTESNFIYLWSKNFIYNSSHFNKFPLFHPSKKNINENIAVIACAGPGLAKDIDIIKKNRNNITLFAVDTAIKPLFKNGINPDFIVSLDGQPYSFEDFMKNQNESAYIFDVFAYPKAVDLCKKIFFTVTENVYEESIIEDFFEKNLIKKFGYQTGGTVSDYALSIVKSIGFKNIYFSGLDLSYPDLITHCNDSPFYERSLRSSCYFCSPENLMIKIIGARNIKNGKNRNFKRDLITDVILENYSLYFEKYSEIFTSLKYFYGNNDGLLINGFNKISLIELINKTGSQRMSSDMLISEQDINYVESENLEKYYKESIESLYKISLKLKNLFEKTNFDIENKENVDSWNILILEIFKKIPFLKKFTVMTEVVLQKKNVTDENILYYKHLCHNLLQSIYYLIRTFQKTVKMFDNAKIG